MPLDEDSQKKISNEAKVLWSDFLVAYPDYSPEKLFEHGLRAKTIRKMLLDFFTFCTVLVEQEFDHVEIRWSDLSAKRQPENNNRAVSWLSYMDYDRRVLGIHLDIKCLVEEVPSPLMSLVKAKLILHEIGHLYHWDELFALTSSHFANEATGEQEAQAWWFCYNVLGFAVAECACNKKMKPQESGLPPIWQLIQMRESSEASSN